MPVSLRTGVGARDGLEDGAGVPHAAAHATRRRTGAVGQVLYTRPDEALEFSRLSPLEL
jgi:hypothetical protein